MRTPSSDGDDLTADPSTAQPRALALRALPRPLELALDDPGVLHVRQDGLDDTVITLLRVEEDGDFIYLQRAVWCFDEVSLSWRVDSNELWELPRPLAEKLTAALLRTFR